MGSFEDLSEDFLRLEALSEISKIFRDIFEGYFGLDPLTDKILEKEFLAVEHSEVRKDLLEFLTSFGLKETPLEFQYRLEKKLPLLLNKDIYDFYFRDRKDLRSLIHSLSKETLGGSNKDSIIQFTREGLKFSENRIKTTLDFMWSLTYKSDGSRRKIYLYFLPKNAKGFGYRERQYNYLPIMNSPEWNLFESTPSRQARGVVLDPDHPELFNPSEILAAMNVESALCVARTSDMTDNEILFAFDEFRAYMPHLIRNDDYAIGPNLDGLIEKNTHEYLTLYFNYWKIIERSKMVGLYAFRDSNDFFNIFNDKTDSLLWFITQYDPPSYFDPRWYK